MNLANPETKVGLFAVIALLSLISLFLWLNGTQFLQRGKDIEVAFDRIEGLRPGATVKYIGVDVGRISRIYFDGPQVIVVIRIQPEIKVPKNAKVIISSSGVIGDKFLEIVPAKPGEVTKKGNRLIGQSPVTMEQFYTAAYDVLDSLRTVADSIKYFVTDPEIGISLRNTLIRFDKISADLEKVSNQLKTVDYVAIFNRLDHIVAMVERMALNNEPQLNEFIANITNVSTQLTEASITANRFLKDMDNNGQTATQLKETLANIDKISANLEKFTTVLATKEQDVNTLIKDAHETMQSIKNAADNVNKAVDQLTTGNGSLAQVKETIEQTNEASQKVNNFMTAVDQISVKNSIGAHRQKEPQLIVDYKLDVGIDNKNGLILGWNDIGQTNTTNLQWAFKSPRITGRLGVYKNKFGAGLDFPATSNLSFNLDAWDNYSPNVGLTTNWEFIKNWTVSLGAQSSVENINNNNLDFELWHKF